MQGMRVKQFLVVTFLLLFIGTNYAADSPVIKFRETMFDFGRVEQGKVIKHDFEFTNEGKATLTVEEILIS